MNLKVDHWFKKPYPRNYILRHPYQGAGIIALFCFGFVMIYRPLEAHQAGALSYIQTMAFYCLMSGITTLVVIQLLRRLKYFADIRGWTFGKEMLFILVVLTGFGVAVYLMGFWIEPPANRWNVTTFLDSFISAFLVGILPFLFFTSLHHRYLLYPAGDVRHMYRSGDPEVSPGEEPLHIQSKLKRGSLDFFPGQFLYAESDGNYVHFQLMQKGKLTKMTIRNSISDIERQLSHVPWFFRSHRAYIVNLKKVEEKQGNASGYRLKIKGTHHKVPVSRSNAGAFDKKFRTYQI